MNEMGHFKRDEFECQCGCGWSVVDYEVIEVLEDTRSHFGDKPVIITSGCRCKKHNADVGGADNSMHLRGLAVDFKIKDIHEDRVAEHLLEKYPHKYGIGRYIGRTHLDVRREKARWDKR